MKTKEEILKMSEEELQEYKWSDDLSFKKKDKEENIDCSHCFDCSNCSYCSSCSHCFDCSYCSYCSTCSDCSDCFDCLYCRNLRDKRTGYYICNVEVTKEEFEKKLKEIKNEN